MESQDLIKQAKRILEGNHLNSIYIEALEFLRLFAGEKSSIFIQLSEVHHRSSPQQKRGCAINALNAFIRLLENGSYDGISIERKAQIDVVSDILEQARLLLSKKGVHPAAPCVLIGASLEEFLRNWVEEKGLSITSSKPSIDSFSKALKEKELLTKQDMKDIASWRIKKSCSSWSMGRSK